MFGLLRRKADPVRDPRSTGRPLYHATSAAVPSLSTSALAKERFAPFTVRTSVPA
jgi:hypothetical protein